MSEKNEKDRSKSGANLTDIARAAGVSVSTVSRALRGDSNIGAETKQRIASLAQEMSYQGPKGRNVAQVHIDVLMYMSDFENASASFYQEIFEGIESVIDQTGYTTSLTLLEGKEKTFEQIEALKKESHIGERGILLIGIDDEAVKKEASRLCPIVLVNSQDSLMQFDGVAPANARGGYLATRHLIQCGHTRILHLTNLERSTIRDRLEGYKQALVEFGIPFDKNLVVHTENMMPEGGAKAIREALESNMFEATAIFGANDLICAGAISALKTEGTWFHKIFQLLGLITLE